MVTAVAAVLEPPSRSPLRRRHRLANGAGATTGDFELRHWRPAKKSSSSGMKGRWVPPEIEIPSGEEGGYTSLRDIISSPEYAAAKQAHSPADGAGGGGDVHMIRHPLVKHAAYAYLQLTPSAREDPGRLRRRRRGPLCRLVLGCLGFVGAFFTR
ncbi:hypothetical protein CFC21_052787 [Triticum aestivum]|uniref:Uncharacterized protein n=4 Tax=Triticum TaxID=4564 RepID=A0A9R0SF34_TRITD|nr:uncharacterized protein LOC119286323 [Triticum dicoccoides]XP_044364205.1 uncharacterized protein LOC123086510 [Triticum aestivum]XP_048570166.1 uncharacterized protein LOC125551057 [Triticum urartu]VAH92985.1 unnamed protein product [Triticum turgidum subsp. durum]EMS45458.1 hypothetical protein TRIUR3_22538 [Triticum urartu]KAF7043426.1 hypothetical protein CFC21_052787 [Triticum aestivum]